MARVGMLREAPANGAADRLTGIHASQGATVYGLN